MDDKKLDFLFRPGVDEAVLADRDAWDDILRPRVTDPAEGRGTLVATLDKVIAAQIFDDRPPEVWATAERLLASGFDRDRVMSQLVMALLVEMQEVLLAERDFDEAAYVADLAKLPLLDPAELLSVALEVVAAQPGIAADDVIAEVGTRSGFTADDRAAVALAERVADELLTTGRWAMLAPDRVVDPFALANGIVLTHRLSDSERRAGILAVCGDLAGFAHLDGPLRLAEATIDCYRGGWSHRSWRGPLGWLEAYPADAMLAVRVTDDEIDVEVVQPDDEPAVDPAFAADLQAAYDREVEEPDLPVDISDLVWALLIDDPQRFATPHRPLTEVCRELGLEIREGHVAHDPDLWDSRDQLHRLHQAMDLLDDQDEVLAVVDAIDVLDGRTTDPAEIEAAIGGLDLDVISPVATIVLGGEDDDDGAFGEPVGEVLERLLTRRWRPPVTARLRWFAALAAERRRDPHAAIAHLEHAVRADDRFLPAIDRLAWCRSDQGDAGAAARLWRRVEAHVTFNPDLAIIEELLAAPSGGVQLGRNERCWCGSGRKFKACHLGRAERPALPDRVAWLMRKAVAYTERRGGEVVEDIIELAELRAGSDDPDAVERALRDPTVIDVALVELGWFERFLAERGPLLPDDEALLAQAWTLVERTVYEVTEVEAGAGLRVRDLRTGDDVDVRERTFSRAARVGMLLCGRAVPDGVSHQFVGGLFSVPPGTERDLIDILDDEDGYELMSFLGGWARPPRLATREGEVSVDCRAVLEIEDPAAARAVLDRHYEAEDDGTDAARWVELFDLYGDGEERVLRATLVLENERLEVTTMSEERLDRVLGLLAAELPSAKVVSDARRPLDAETMRETPAGSVAPFDDEDSPALRAALEEIRDRFERRWCDEPVPALGGLTPRAAAADVTRREEVVRLLASFPEPGPDDDIMAGGRGGAMMRPARLRELLGLD